MCLCVSINIYFFVGKSVHIYLSARKKLYNKKKSVHISLSIKNVYIFIENKMCTLFFNKKCTHFSCAHSNKKVYTFSWKKCTYFVGKDVHILLEKVYTFCWKKCTHFVGKKVCTFCLKKCTHFA